MSRSDVASLWLRVLQEIADRAAHEVKDSLNGVSLNVEVVRSRSRRPDAGAAQVAEFAAAAALQLEALAERTEALLFLVRPPRRGTEVDVALTMKHLAALLVPAARADNVTIATSGSDQPAPTRAPAEAVRLVLAAGLLSLADLGGSGSCRLEREPGAVVRFSHESAGTCSLDSAIAAAVAEHDIIIESIDRRGGPGGGGADLRVAFPES